MPEPRIAAPPEWNLSAATWLRIARDPLAARLVGRVWSRLADLEHAGHDPGALAALRYELARHQPTRRGTCRACGWWTLAIIWRHRRWPCLTWIRARIELLDAGNAIEGR